MSNGQVIKSILTAFLALAAGCDSSVSEPASTSRPPDTRPDSDLSAPPAVAAPDATAEPRTRRDHEQTPLQFTDVTAESGVSFVYYGVPSPQAYMTEQNGGGVAVFDSDGDRIPDLFLSNGSHFERPATSASESSQLYRGSGNCSFEKMTLDSGLQHHGHGMGVACGDFDNDGFTDLFLACFGRNVLFQNQGDGTFRRIACTAIDAADDWSCSPAFADFNGDGLLDLYVVNYVDWTSDDAPCTDPEHPELRRTCSPTAKNAVADQLLMNSGDSTFESVGESAGIADTEIGKGLALGVLDFNRDGALDVYVANDTTANSLFLNQGDARFVDAAIEYGVAVSVDGVHGASMGVGIADFDQNGFEDLLVTNFRNQVNDLYASLGDAGFVFANTRTGLDIASRSKLSFGTVFRDFNGDSWPDILIANGHIWDLTSLGAQYEYEMTASLLLNQSGTRFRDVSPKAGEYFHRKRLGRAAATGDLDNDGDLDLVVQHLESPAAILRNDSTVAAPGILVDFVGVRSCRNPLGCRVRYEYEGKVEVSHISSGESFQASHDRRVLIPAESEKKLDWLEITWPDGRTETWDGLSLTPGTQQVAVEGGDIYQVSMPSGRVGPTGMRKTSKQ